MFNVVTRLYTVHNSNIRLFRLREGSSEEAERTCQHVTSLGVEQHTVTLDWGDQGIPPPGKVQVLAREKRYTTLLNLCRDMDINTLMLAHHQDDQNGEDSN